MVTDDLAQHGSQSLQGLVRANRLALAQPERDRGGTQRIAVALPFPVRVSGGYAHPISGGVICATRGGRTLTNLSGGSRL